MRILITCTQARLKGVLNELLGPVQWNLVLICVRILITCMHTGSSEGGAERAAGPCSVDACNTRLFAHYVLLLITCTQARLEEVLNELLGPVRWTPATHVYLLTCVS